MIVDLRRHPWLSLLVLALLAFFDPHTWGMWTFRVTFLNDGSTSGTHQVDIQPGDGNICVLLGGSFDNGDGSARNSNLNKNNADGNAVRHLLGGTAVSVGAGAVRNFPTSEATADENAASSPPPIVFAGTEKLVWQLLSVAVNENSIFAVEMLVSGGPPTVTLTSPNGATETETENRII